MKRIILIGCLLIGFSTSLFSQESSDEPKITLPDAVMEQVVKRIVTWYFKPSKKPKTIYFASENIKKEWLPQINNIKFVVLEKPAPNHYPRKVYFFKEIEKLNKGFGIRFGYGDPDCEAIGDPWAFRFNDNRVKLWQIEGNWLSFCSGPNDHA
ncbi:MAG: hypothetical protein IPL32_12130 [Chloracidobacterium sp.]|nr:hypothetical protein [Chloracidobacterium sp.]